MLNNMIKLSPILIIVMAAFLYASPQINSPHINKNGSISFTTPDSKETTISMDGKTPYGLDIKEEKKIIRRKHFTVVILYSKKLSDNIMTPFMKKYYLEIIKLTYRWVYNNRLPKYRKHIVISNCRFCKTGYCKRKDKKEISVASFKDGVRDRNFTFSHEELLKKKAYVKLAKKTISILMGDGK